MTKAEQFDKAWRLAFKANDFSLVDERFIILITQHRTLLRE